ncbi:MAG: DUF45 domain-containing protein [Tenericutes bacterium]|nr:DUF45 domain-containing protein [Mycoplasmatota bacterium]
MNKIKLGDKYFYYQVFYKNIKNMYLRLNEDVLNITCNKLITEKQIENFIFKSQSNILKKAEIQLKKVQLYNQERMLMFGEEYSINFSHSKTRNSYFLNENEVIINFKKDYFDNKYIEKIYKELLINQMVKIYNEIYPWISKHFSIDNLTFKGQLMKSRFGSCIPKKRIIKLNTMLSRFDTDYIRVVLIHELIHLEVHNHQKEFYKYMNAWIPEYKKYIKNLNILTRKYVI